MALWALVTRPLWRALGRVFCRAIGFPLVEIEGVEADDVIAYVVQHKKYEEWEKVIVSSDKDFFQLISDDCKLYRPIQDQLVDYPTLVENFKIHPRNFALARSLVGDKSDNLPGVPRVGLKTVASKFPFLNESKQYEVEDIMSCLLYTSPSPRDVEESAVAA